MISYAQNFEDVILRRLFRDRTDGFYIDVGAMDPVFDSVTKHFYDLGWSGINVEPNEHFYSRLLELRPRDINLNLALGDKDEEKEFYVFEDIGNSTFDVASRERCLEQGFEAKPKRIKVTTLAAICRDYVRRPIDFLKIDCEGWEKFVLNGADWDRFRPIVLVIEATEPGTDIPAWSEWEPCLIEHARYDMVYFDGLNRFYLRREDAVLRFHFELPPNFFDQFKLHSTESAEQAMQRAVLRAEGLEEKLNRVAGENQRLADSIRTKEAEMAAALQAKDTAFRLKSSELEAQIASYQERVAELEKERDELHDKLLKSRLWVGRLSQDLAAAKRKP